MPENNTKPSYWYTASFLAMGLGLLIGGIYITLHLLVTIKEGIVYFFILFLPAPMIIFGFHAVISALRRKSPSKSIEAANETVQTVASIIRKENPELSTEKKEHNKEVAAYKKLKKEHYKNTHITFTDLFIIFGIVFILIIIVGAIVIDIYKGTTRICPRGQGCYVIHLADSPINFYVHLFLDSVKALVFPIILGVYMKYKLSK